MSGCRSPPCDCLVLLRPGGSEASQWWRNCPCSHRGRNAVCIRAHIHSISSWGAPLLVYRFDTLPVFREEFLCQRENNGRFTFERDRKARWGDVWRLRAAPRWIAVICCRIIDIFWWATTGIVLVLQRCCCSLPNPSVVVYWSLLQW